jgi:hypothetical protein
MQNRIRDSLLAFMESIVAMTTRNIAALFIGFAYLACAISVALHLRSLWDIGIFFALIFAGNFLIVVGLDLRREKK